MITISNYHKTIKDKGIKRSDLGEKLQMGWDFVEKIWKSGQESWLAYESSDKIKNTVDTYFKLLDEFIRNQPKAPKPTRAKKKSPKSDQKLSMVQYGNKVIEKIIAAGHSKTKARQIFDPYEQFVLEQHQKGVSVQRTVKLLLDRVEEGFLFSAGITYKDKDGKQQVGNIIFRTKEVSVLSDKKKLEAEAIRHFKRENKGDYSEVTGANDFLVINPGIDPSRTKRKSKKTSSVSKKSTQQKVKSKPYIDPNAEKVEAYSLEHKFIKRFVNMDGKAKTRNHFRLFINALQKAIREKRIRKTSKYAKEILSIQDALIKTHGRFKSDDEQVVTTIPDRIKADYLKILGRQIELPSVKLIKSYINLQGKIIPNVKAKNLYNRIVRAIQSGKIGKRDKYGKEIEGILERLTTFVNKNKTSGILTIEPKTLNGLSDIVGDCGCHEKFNGFGRIPDNVIMSSVDVLKLKFDKLGFSGKWLDFIGNPARNFSMMIFGLPKFGKSILAIAFASYLANNFGTVLYVAREEGIDDTLQEKLENVAHPDLFVVGSLPSDLEAFDFIFLDSVSKLGMTPADIDSLRAKYPGKGFVSVFQTRKDGNFRGSQEFQHDVDIVVEVPEKGRAVQYGRYNQGGEMNIFSGSLDGVKKK
ncbi:MAG: hypothetical protein HUJ25_15740 [Crocinitomicaceae bacterium]|nr:hypothetical protein [Crocinitomicaceae bacterium]